MNKYNDCLKKLSEIEPASFTDIFLDFQKIMEYSFLRQLNIVSESRYRINPSVGMGRLAKIWWCGIFDIDFYKKAYHISDKRKISAKIGYYVVYLLNEDKTKLYLSINQASKNISLHKNSIAKQKMLETNHYLRQFISLKPNYLTNINGRLSKNDLPQARDYETASIIAIEYDLFNSEITDLQYKIDLLNILDDFDVIKKKILELYIDHDNYDINVEDHILDSSSMDMDASTKKNMIYPLSDEKRDFLNKRDVKYSYTNVNKEKPKAERNNDLVEYVIRSSDYKCAIDQTHITFMGKLNHSYVEVHHLIPMKFQYLFGNFNLDCTDNMVCVCPNCHAAIHHGSLDVQRRILKPLYESSIMKEILKSYGFANDFDEFIEKFYN